MVDEIILGYSVSQTGRFADRAAPWYRNAYELWAKQANARSGILGRPVRLLAYDDESDADKAAANYHRLIKTDGLRTLLGPCHTALMRPILPVIEEHQALLVQGTHGAHADFQSGGEWHFLCWPGCDFDYSKPYLELKAPNISSAALVHTGGRIGMAVSAGARHHAERLGIEIVFDEAIASEPFDYPNLMGRANATDADVLLICLDHNRSDEPRLASLRAAHDAGIPADTIWHSDFPVAADNKLGAANEGIHMRVTWVPEITDPRSQKFAADYRAAYNSEAEFHCAGGFACGEVLEQAAAAVGTWDAADVRDIMLDRSFDTVCGQLRFQTNGQPDGNLRVGYWTGSKLVIVEEE